MKPGNDIEFLMQCSQQLWGEGGFKSLIRKLMSLLQDDFGAELCSYLSLGSDSAKSPGGQEIPVIRSLDDGQVNGLKKAFINLKLDNAENREGVVSVHANGCDYSVAVVTEPNQDLGLVVWRMSALAQKAMVVRRGLTSPGVVVMALDFLVRQVQGECRWFRKMDSAQAMLYRDDLTGVFNYRYLDVAIDAELRRVSRFGSFFCLLFIDLDNFKTINDRFGHLSGSSVLKQVAGRLREAVREVDSIIRYGGDEYVVVLLGATSAAGLLAAERVRRKICDAPFDTEDGTKVPLTASIGVAACPEHGEDKADLLRIADETMYRSKRAGKNRVTIIGPASKEGTTIDTASKGTPRQLG